MENSWRFHLSLNVANLAKSVAFYQGLFDIPPAKCHDDYAKFEVPNPPVVFSLVPHAVSSGGATSRVGLKLGDEESLQEIRGRCEKLGIRLLSLKDHFLLHDPDGNQWQLSADDIDPPQTSEVAVSSEAPPDQPIVWEHYVNAGMPERIPHHDGSVDEVRLTGAFNGTLTEADRHRLIRETYRVLKPGGRVVVHGLASDKPFPNGMPALPGLAAMVSRMPVQNEPVEVLQAEKFINLQFVKFSEKAWFEHDGVQLREIKVLGWKPLCSEEDKLEVIYRGPFQQVRDDQGNRYPRGQKVAVASGMWEMLRRGPQAEGFLFLDPKVVKTSCELH